MTTHTTGAVSPPGATGSPPRTEAAREQAAQVAGTAKDQAVELAGTAKDQAVQVASTAKEQGAQVVGEAVDQTRALVGQATEQLNAQATEQTQRLTDNLRQVAEQLQTMAGAGEHGSTAHSLVSEAASRTHSVASYLDGKQPGDLVGDLQHLGRRRPGTFLLGAALAGFAIGRLANAVRKASTPDTPSTELGGPATAAGGDSLPGVYPSGPPLVGGAGASSSSSGAPTIEPYPAPVLPPTDGSTPAGGW
ncbi:MAG: hypothetical protein QOC82_731 [Frankiaceae bacterium]|jgi:gas vesicle protein|nr:hypothetical protein [Frankiaceae bacterium]